MLSLTGHHVPSLLGSWVHGWTPTPGVHGHCWAQVHGWFPTPGVRNLSMGPWLGPHPGTRGQSWPSIFTNFLSFGSQSSRKPYSGGPHETPLWLKKTKFWADKWTPVPTRGMQEELGQAFLVHFRMISFRICSEGHT